MKPGRLKPGFEYEVLGGCVCSGRNAVSFLGCSGGGTPFLSLNGICRTMAQTPPATVNDSQGAKIQDS